MEPFISMILPWAANFAPRGWAFCRGQLLSIAQNQTLFSLLGSIYGGDGVSTFALPDLSGRTILGAGVYPGMPEFKPGQQGGLPHRQIEIDNMPLHAHTISNDLSVTLSVDTANPGNQYTPGAGSVLGQAVTLSSANNQVKAYSDQPATTNIKGGGVSGTITAGEVGGGKALDTLPPYLVLNYIIALDGLYPSRA